MASPGNGWSRGAERLTGDAALQMFGEAKDDEWSRAGGRGLNPQSRPLLCGTLLDLGR